MVKKQASSHAERKVVNDQHGRAFARDVSASQDLERRLAAQRMKMAASGRLAGAAGGLIRSPASTDQRTSSGLGREPAAMAWLLASIGFSQPKLRICQLIAGAKAAFSAIAS
ncbi:MULTISPECIES: hypothetical protein [unclassified Mesorhizobium]|uniref:hypothetical protein n=1 Tax=unclassified Mesorhizobium TaxID=325217 RepID=UPI0019258634|nr:MULTISPECIES: hypothetical protein [unclassified Mesorhizobium]